jgi:hypothetical protein
MKRSVQTLMIAAVAAMVFVAPPAIAADTDESEAQSKVPRKITDRRHPDYVRCRSEPVIGSIAKKRRVCMTNAEWAEYVRTGSRNAKEFVDDNQPGFMLQPQ